MCFMNDGSAMSNGAASSPMLAGPLPSRPSTARRVGSARAWNTAVELRRILSHKAKYNDCNT